MSSRRTASDSLTSAKEVMQSALQPITAPAHEPLFDGAQAYWDEIISARANTDWPAEDLTLAAKLANVMLLHKDALDDLRALGHTVTTQGGNTAANPLVTISKTYMSDIKAMRTDLQIHGRGKNGEARDVGKRRGQRKAIQSQAVDNPLIARPK